MYWTDTGYLLNKNNYSENSVIIDVFTLKHGKISAIVYGGSSKKNKKDLQIGNKILVNYNSKMKIKLATLQQNWFVQLLNFFSMIKEKLHVFYLHHQYLKFFYLRGKLMRKFLIHLKI